MIASIDLKTMRNSEYIQFMHDTLGITVANNPAAMLVQVQYDGLNTAVTTLDGLFVTDQASPLTAQVTALDLRRDAALNGITALANAYTYHFDPALKAHADTLSHQLGLYGAGIAKDNYQSETNTINSILNDWNTQPALVAAITALGLTAWKAELQTANTSFSTVYLQRTQQMGAASADTINAKRIECNNAYYLLRNFIDSYFTINGGANPYGKVTNELNALIDQYNVLLAGRAATPAPEETPAPKTEEK